MLLYLILVKNYDTLIYKLLLMWLHRILFFFLIIMVFFSLNLGWFYTSYNGNSINPFLVEVMNLYEQKQFWGDLYLYETYVSYTALALFIIFSPKQFFVSTAILRFLMLIISVQIILGVAIVVLQSNTLSISSINGGFILFLMVNLALIKRFLSFWSAALSNNKYTDENILD